MASPGIVACDLGNEADIIRAVGAAPLTTDHIDRHFAVNVRGTILVTCETLPHLREGGRNPLARIGRPAQIAAAIHFLASPGASFFTGQCLGANGGAAML